MLSHGSSVSVSREDHASASKGFPVHTIGRHLIAELYGCDHRALDEVDTVRHALLAATRAIEATVVAEAFHRFSPQGVSGTVIIAESHLSVHTWPEKGYVAVDIYTCGGLDPRGGIPSIREALSAQSVRLQEIVRGLPEDLEAHRDLVPDDVHVVTRMGTDIEI